MRGSKAKKLRRQAESITVGKPEKAYVRNSQTGETRLRPDCTRAVYKSLKKGRNTNVTAEGRKIMADLQAQNAS